MLETVLFTYEHGVMKVGVASNTVGNDRSPLLSRNCLGFTSGRETTCVVAPPSFREETLSVLSSSLPAAASPNTEETRSLCPPPTGRPHRTRPTTPTCVELSTHPLGYPGSRLLPSTGVTVLTWHGWQPGRPAPRALCVQFNPSHQNAPALAQAVLQTHASLPGVDW